MRLGRLLRAAALFLALAAVAQELSKPEGQRSWHGRIAGVPYDFRFPTLKRCTDAYWNPTHDPSVTALAVRNAWSVTCRRRRPVAPLQAAAAMPRALPSMEDMPRVGRCHR